jgi:hypothetical protein
MFAMLATETTLKIKLDWSRLLGFDQASGHENNAQGANRAGWGSSKVGSKLGSKVGTKVGLKPR